MSAGHHVRAATEDERVRYVTSTWAASWVRSRRVGKSAALRTIESLLAGQPVLVVPQVGTDGRAEDVAGWLCYTALRSTAVVHYVYVRADRRREGIARALVQAAGVDTARTVLVTATTVLGDTALRRAEVRTSRTNPAEVIG